MIYHDDTSPRILAVIRANRQAAESGQAASRTGMYTTGLVAEVGTWTLPGGPMPGRT